MVSWNTRLSVTAGRNQSQIKMPRLLVNNFRDLRFSLLGFCSAIGSPEPHYPTTTYLVPLCLTYSDFTLSISPMPSPEFSPNVASPGACILDSHSIVHHLIIFPFVGAGESKLDCARQALHH